MPEHVINWDFLHSSPSPQETERLPVYVRLTLRLTRKANVKGMGKHASCRKCSLGAAASEQQNCAKTAVQAQAMVDLEHLEHGLADVRAHTPRKQLFLEGDGLAQVGV